MIVGIAVLVTNFGVAAWGGVSWLSDRPSVGFWYLLRVAQVSVLVQAAIGGILLASGREPSEGLHLVYGLLPIVIAAAAEGVRAGAAERELGETDFHALERQRQRAVAYAIVRRETAIMAGSCAVIFLLALRAAFVSPVV